MLKLDVKTKYGVIRGYAGESGRCAVFKGVPYAKPPVGELRFAPPEEPEAWEGVKECFEYGNSPVSDRGDPASRQGSVPKDEDCLYLNIWTPAESSDEKLPVMFWIFGGGFQGGTSASPSFDGENLSQKGVIVVNFNYRNGAIGFLALPELNARSKSGTSGNYGLLDEIAALKWVRENIAAFGGDPDRILVHGQSAGGISTRMLTCSPLSRGMFSRAVVQSGGGLNEADLVRPMDELMDIGVKCMERLGYTFEDAMTMDANEFNTAMCDMAQELTGRREVGVFQPCVDGYVLKDVPGVSVAKGDYDQNVDIIVGTVSGDSSMFCRKVKAEIGENIPLLRGVSYSPSQTWARATVREGLKPVHTYYMERRQPPRAPRPGGPGGPGGQRPQNNGFGGFSYGNQCPHGSEIVYVFGNLTQKSDKFEELDCEISETMMTYWTNFAKTGDPNGEGVPQWDAYTAENPVTLHISDSGIAVENIVDSREADDFIEYTMRHPGMLESLHLDD